MIRRNATHTGKDSLDEDTEWRGDESPDNRISIDPLIDRSVSTKKGVIPKLYLQFKKQMDGEKNKRLAEIKNDYSRLKAKIIQKSRRVNLISTGDQNMNLTIPCKIRPRKAEIRVIRPYLSNIKYAVILNQSPLMKMNPLIRKEILKYNSCSDIVPSPQVIESYKIPKTEVSDIENSVVLIRSN